MIINLQDNSECADLRSTLSALLEKRADSAAVRVAAESQAGFDTHLLTELTELGFTTLALPGSAGGLDLGIAECAVVWHELGRRLVPGPATSTLVAGLALATTGSPALDRIGEGASCAIARWEDGIDTLRLVPHGDQADLVLAVGSDRVVLVEGGVARPSLALDPTRRLAEIDMSSVNPVEVGGVDLAGNIDSLMLVAQAVEASGAATRALELTVEHLLVREQFGRPLGSFQALKHRCADLVVAIRGAYATVQDSMRSKPADLDTTAAVARLVAADTLFLAAAEAVQMHGGVGITWEHDIHLYLKRAKATQLLWRTQSELRQRLMITAGLAADQIPG